MYSSRSVSTSDQEHSSVEGEVEGVESDSGSDSKSDTIHIHAYLSHSGVVLDTDIEEGGGLDAQEMLDIVRIRLMDHVSKAHAQCILPNDASEMVHAILDGRTMSHNDLHGRTLGDLTTTSKARQDINIFYHVKPQWEKTIQHHIKTQANKHTTQQTVFNAVLRDMHSRKVAAEERSEQRSNELEQKMEQMMEKMKTEIGRMNKQDERLERMLKDSVKQLEKELEDTKAELQDTKAELKDTKAELAKEKEITRNLQSSLSALMCTQATLNKIRLRILLDYACQHVLEVHGLSNLSWDEATRNLDEDAIFDLIRSASVLESRPLQDKSIGHIISSSARRQANNVAHSANQDDIREAVLAAELKLSDRESKINIFFFVFGEDLGA